MLKKRKIVMNDNNIKSWNFEKMSHTLFRTLENILV